jgi:hypothetical protein
MNDEFVFFALIEEDVDTHSLNLLKMLVALLLQTLRLDNVAKILPSEWIAPWAGEHLNVFSPLCHHFNLKGQQEEVKESAS